MREARTTPIHPRGYRKLCDAGAVVLAEVSFALDDDGSGERRAEQVCHVLPLGRGVQAQPTTLGATVARNRGVEESTARARLHEVASDDQERGMSDLGG